MSHLKIGLISSSRSAQSEERLDKSRGEAEVVKYRRKERNTIGMEGDRNNQSSEQLIVCLTAYRAIFWGQHPWESAK